MKSVHFIVGEDDRESDGNQLDCVRVCLRRTLLGIASRRLLPEHHLNGDSKDVVKLG